MITQRNANVMLFPTLTAAFLLANSGMAQGQDYFDPALLSLGAGDQATTLDLSIFETAGKIPPGTYLVQLFVNQVDRGQHMVVFKQDAHGKIEPELTPDFLHELGVNTRALPAFAGLPTDAPVNNLQTLIPDARTTFDFAQLRLELSVPQIAMQSNARGAIDPALWDNGVPAFMLNYTLNGGRNWQDGQYDMGKSTQTNLFANLRSGFNFQAWRLRSTFTYMRNNYRRAGMEDRTNTNTQFTNTYLQRDIPGWRSEMLMGESSTNNDVLDSVPFRGVKLNSSDDMLPNSLRGFAPVITGIAQTNARVTVSQNGNVIYQTFVPPGPFRIDDLFQTGQGGNLTVTITEVDGTVRTQTQAVASLPVMRRPGSLKYEITAGKYNGNVTVDSEQADFVAGTAIYGLPYGLTLYGGGLVAQDYHSLVAGIGASLGNFGALSVDATTSSAKLRHQDERQHGESYRIRYAKNMLETGTSLDVAAYRYSTHHYYSFTDFNSLGFRLNDDLAPWTLERQRSSFEARINQQLGSLGSLFFSGTRTDYWGNDKVMNSLSAGYNGNYHGVSYGVAYSINRVKSNNSNSWPENRQLSFNVQVPLSLFSPSTALNRSYANYQMTHDNHGRVQQNVGMSGNALDDRLSYNVAQGWSNGQDHSTSRLNTSYRGSQGMATLGYSYGRYNSSLNLGGNGSMVVHPEGVTFGQMVGNSAAIVSAPGAAGASVMQGNVRTDSRGYAVVPYLSNYQRNNIDLNPSTLPDDVDLTQSSLTLYPTKGAVVMANFATRVGYQVLVTLQQKTGDVVPFGALVTLDNSTAGSEPNTGIVGDDGQVYLSGLPENATLRVSWGREANQQCLASINVRDVASPTTSNPIRTFSVRCE